MSGALPTAAAYDRCEAITREQAANFYYGIRLLSRERRRAMCAAYAFARRIDDIGDGELARERKRELLDEVAAQLATLEAGRFGVTGDVEVAGEFGDLRSVAPDPSDAVLVALADAYTRFALPRGALAELIDGVRMDLDGTTYESFEELVAYCRRVAGAIGRVCLAIFGTRGGAGAETAAGRAHAEALADDLGVALQLTNILRDVREDAENGRVYLPGEDLRRFGVLDVAGGDAPARLARLSAGGLADGELEALVRFEAARAEQWFRRGIELVPLLDRRSAACVSAMAGIYHRLLARIEADPARALHGRVSLSRSEKARVAVRSLLGARP